MEPVLRDALAAAGPDATAIDLACSEGWFAHRLLEWGARQVVGIDVRPENIRRAELVRDHLGLDRRRLRFKTADVMKLRARQPFTVVLCLGLIYHLENPIGALRIARSLTRGVCIVESQLTEQTEPIRHGWGADGHVSGAGRKLGGLPRGAAVTGRSPNRGAWRRGEPDPEPRSARPGHERRGVLACVGSGRYPRTEQSVHRRASRRDRGAALDSALARAAQRPARPVSSGPWDVRHVGGVQRPTAARERLEWDVEQVVCAGLDSAVKNRAIA